MSLSSSVRRAPSRASRETSDRVARAAAGTPLLLSRDPVLAEHLLRLAAAAGTAPQVCEDAGAALRWWGSAPLVLVDPDLAEDLAGLSPARREGVHLVAWSPVSESCFRTALALGAQDVVELPRCDAWLTDLIGDAGEGAGTNQGGPGLVVGVVGGSGGAGATTLAAALGQVAGQSGPTVVIDLDPRGPGLDRVLGLEEREGVGWDDLARSAGRLGGRALRDALPHRGRLGVLTWRQPTTASAAGAEVAGGELGPVDGGSLGAGGGPAPVPPPGTVVGEVVEGARRGHRTVVVDLPRAVSADADALARLDRLLVVGRPGVSAAASLVRQLAAVTAGLSTTVEPLLVVRGTPLDGSRLERATGVPLLLSMGDQRGLAESVDLGLGPVRHRRGVLARAADEALRLLALRGPTTSAA